VAQVASQQTRETLHVFGELGRKLGSKGQRQRLPRATPHVEPPDDSQKPHASPSKRALRDWGRSVGVWKPRRGRRAEEASPRGAGPGAPR
jgi:hypothetical protein